MTTKIQTVMTANEKLADESAFDKWWTGKARELGTTQVGDRSLALLGWKAALRSPSPAQGVVNLPQDEDGTYWRLKNGNLYSKNSTTQIGYGDMRAVLSVLEELESGTVLPEAVKKAITGQKALVVLSDNSALIVDITEITKSGGFKAEHRAGAPTLNEAIDALAKQLGAGGKP